MNATVRMTGPLFGGDAPAKIRRIAENSVRQLVEMGDERLNELLRPRPAGVYLSVQEAKPGKASTGHYRRSIHATVESLFGSISDSNVVYGPWLEGTSSRNQTTRFKGYRSFRQTADWMNKRAPDVMNGWAKRILGELS